MHIFKRSNYGFGSLHVVFEGGSSIDPIGKRGMTHLVEHLMCSNTDCMQVKLYESGIDLNAQTSMFGTEFYMKGLDDSIMGQGVTFLRKLLGKPQWDEDFFETEKKVVLQEYGEAVAGYAFTLNVQRKYYGLCDALGIRKEIESITYGEALQFVKDHFKKPTRIVQLGAHKLDLGFVSYLPSPGDLRAPIEKRGKVPLEKEKPTEAPTVLLCSRQEVPDSEYHLVAFIASMLANGLDSPLMTEVRGKRGLAYGAGIDLMLYAESFSIVLGGSTNKAGAKELLEVLKEFLGNVSTHMSKKRFDSTKKHMQSSRKAKELSGMRNSHLLYDGRRDQYKWLDQTTYREVVKAAKKWLNPEKFEGYIEGATKW